VVTTRQLDPRANERDQELPGACWKLITVHWPILFGTKVQPLLDYAVNSHLTQEMRGAGLLLAAMMVVAAVPYCSTAVPSITPTVRSS
jgi:hypothetical protein